MSRMSTAGPRYLCRTCRADLHLSPRCHQDVYIHAESHEGSGKISDAEISECVTENI